MPSYDYDRPPPEPPIVDISAGVFAPQTYVPNIPFFDRVKQTGTVVDWDTIRLGDPVTGFESINLDPPKCLLAYLAEAPGGVWELGYLSSREAWAEVAGVTRIVDTHHSANGLTTLGGFERIPVGTEVTISLVLRSNSGVCVGGSPTVASAKGAAFGDCARATATAAIALGHKVLGDRVGGSTIGSGGIGYLGVDVAGHREHKFVVGAQTSDWTLAQTLVNNQRGLSTGYVGTGAVKLKASVYANYMRFDGGTPTMSPAADVVLFDVTAELYAVDGVVTQVLAQQITQTFAGANSVQHEVSITAFGDLVVSASTQVGPARTIAFVTITDLTQSIYT